MSAVREWEPSVVKIEDFLCWMTKKVRSPQPENHLLPTRGYVSEAVGGSDKARFLWFRRVAECSRSYTWIFPLVHEEIRSFSFPSYPLIFPEGPGELEWTAHPYQDTYIG